jgi:hypothetical protein
VRRRRQCVCALVVADLNQVEPAQKPFETVHRIQTRKNFNIPRLATEVEKFMATEPEITTPGAGKHGIPCSVACVVPLAVIIIGVLVLYLNFTQ